MLELDLNKPAGILIKTTCVDYPEHLAGSFFLKGCNLHCPYCYNKTLVNNEDNSQLSSVQDLFNHLEKRQGILSGLVISGGEPLLNPYTPLIIKKARKLGYKIKLDTNGTLPHELNSFITNPELRPDFLAIDLKTTPEKYANILCPAISHYYRDAEYFSKVLYESCHLLSDYQINQYEIRTVLVPSLVSKEEVSILADFIPEKANWKFAQFQNNNCLSEEYNEILPYTDSEITEIIDFAKKLRSGAILR